MKCGSTCVRYLASEVNGEIMRINQTASVTHPIAITGEFLDRLAGIFSDLKDSAYEVLARKHSLDIGEIKRIETLPKDQLQDPDWPEGNDRAEYDKHIGQIRQRGVQRQVVSELRSTTETTYSVTYDSGLRTGTDNIDQFKGILKEETGKVEFIHVSYGEYGSTRVKIRIGGAATAATVDISGERKDVDFVFRSVSELLRSSTPDHPFLHQKWLQAVVSIALGTLFTNAAFSLLGINLAKDSPPEKQMVAEVILPVALGIPVILGILYAIEKAFPKCQVEFGSDWRHQKALRARLYGVLTIVLIPVLINIFVK